jgi:hypothetical protein
MREPEPKPHQYSRSDHVQKVASAFFLAIAAAALLAGCEEAMRPEQPESQPVAIGAKFDSKQTGTISGRVVWTGPAPGVPPLNVALPQAGGRTEARSLPDPNSPKIDPQTNGIAGAVVYLEHVDPERAKPWNYSPVHIEMRAEGIRVVQGETPVPAGFVRLGDEIEMTSREAVMQSLCVRGAAFFTLAFPDPDRPLRRRLNHGGLVELSSGMGHYWWRGYVFVCPHSYFNWTDAEGRFTLTQVPAGDMRVVCWLPNSKIARTERDPNTIAILRLAYEKPLERASPIRLEVGAIKQMEIQMTQD